MHPATYRTRLKNGGSGARFRAELTEVGHVRVTLQKGQQHVLPERDFADLSTLYFRREQGEAVTARAKAVSHYSMYFWGVSTGALYERSFPGVEERNCKPGVYVWREKGMDHTTHAKRRSEVSGRLYLASPLVTRDYS